MLPGGSFFHHADSFGMIRGNHIDICVLGAFQISEEGDLANWSTAGPDASGPAVDQLARSPSSEIWKAPNTQISIWLPRIMPKESA